MGVGERWHGGNPEGRAHGGHVLEHVPPSRPAAHPDRHGDRGRGAQGPRLSQEHPHEALRPRDDLRHPHPPGPRRRACGDQGRRTGREGRRPPHRGGLHLEEEDVHRTAGRREADAPRDSGGRPPRGRTRPGRPAGDFHPGPHNGEHLPPRRDPVPAPRGGRREQRIRTPPDGRPLQRGPEAAPGVHQETRGVHVREPRHGPREPDTRQRIEAGPIPAGLA